MGGDAVGVAFGGALDDAGVIAMLYLLRNTSVTTTHCATTASSTTSLANLYSVPATEMPVLRRVTRSHTVAWSLSNTAMLPEVPMWIACK